MVGRFAVCGLLALTIVACTHTIEVTALSTPIPLFSEGDAGYACYRIPAIIRAANGDLIAFAEARRYGKQDAGDIDLVMRRSSDEGQTWGPITIIWDDSTHTCGNPAPVVVGTAGKIVMLTTWNRGEDHERDIEQRTSLDTRRAFVMHSDDHGHTWSEAREITSIVKDSTWTWYATGPCHAIQMVNGRIVIPCNHGEFDEEAGKTLYYRAHVIVSDDLGKTWRLGGTVENISGNETAVEELADGRLYLNTRCIKEHPCRVVAYSSDGGDTWVDAHPDASLPDPECQGSVIAYPKPSAGCERPILFSNNPYPSMQPWGSGRRDLTVRMSLDDGKTWTYKLCIHEGKTAYGDLTVLSDGSIACLYECGEEHAYEQIALKIFTLDELKMDEVY